jgi:acetolactate synthase I/II/III large subunit
VSTDYLGIDLLCDSLSALGVSHIFGLPGTQNVPFIDALSRTNLKLIVTSHELGASFAANGYARSSGRPGILATISGPGFTYALSGIAEAKHDSVPLLYLVFAEDDHAEKTFRLQELPLEVISKAIAKAAYSIRKAEEIVPVLADAYRATLQQEPGPVVVVIYRSAALAESSRDANPPKGAELAAIAPAPDDLAAALSRIKSCTKPLLILGQGAAGASTDLRELTALLNPAVITTLSGRGIIPDNHPNLLPVDFSVTGADVPNRAAEEADLILVIGAKLSHNGSGGFALNLPPAKLIRVDTSPEVLLANYPASLSICADAGLFTRALLTQLKASAAGAKHWLPDELSRYREELLLQRRGSSKWKIRSDAAPSPEALFNLMRAALPTDTIFVTDAGYHQTLTRACLEVREPRTLLAPSDFQSMGYSLPAALGAAIANPAKKIVAILGDGGLLMNCAEIATAVRQCANLTIVVFCDGKFGSIAQQQISFCGRELSVTLPQFDLEQLAFSLRAQHLSLSTATDRELRQTLAGPGTTVLTVRAFDTPDYKAAKLKSALRNRICRALGSTIIALLKPIIRASKT